ncbi:Pectinesterase inhibitor domain containing protein [Trema orientale]|uniref:Pectinesterase n=1 Tax=Trema orientale TaxID=63057 RepID=A0A2P5ARN3_TREOI|nr:Pectinesterase inhibitor domain containing protein [Trema orientale]
MADLGRPFSSTKKLLGVLLLCVLISTSFVVVRSNTEDFLEPECLKVTKYEFTNSVNTIVDVIRQVVSTLSQFGNFFGDFRVSNAVSDCLDLLDSSAEELSWTVSATQNPKGKHNSTGNLSSDLRTWLSAALINQDTCSDGFEGTNSIVKGLVTGGLNQITSMVQELLTQVSPISDLKPKSSIGGNKAHFPPWVKPKDRKLIEANGVAADAVVAADGTGKFTKIMDAVSAAPEYSMKRYVIYVKKGTYFENVEIKKKKWNIMMIGDGIDATIISGNRSVVDGWTTFRSATFAVSGRGFIARDITFENTAGPEKHQAVALRSDSDLSVFYRCRFRGYQDTLYTHTMRQFFRECDISGTVDFIFGDATAVFQNCQIRAKRGLPNQKNTITAQGRKDPNEPTGFAIQFSNITADSDLVGFVNSTETYLGRPWKLYSRTVIMQSFISDVVRPKGWLEWNADFALDTLFYGEFMNYGPGAGLGSRVKWPGYHPFNDSSLVNNYTVAQFIEGNLWLPSTGVKYTAGLEA